MTNSGVGPLKELQRRIYQNKIRHGFNTSNDHAGINQEICHLTEELGEVAAAWRRGKKKDTIDGVIDLIVFGLGLLEILEADGDVEMEQVILQNEKRKYRMNPDGSCVRIE